MSFVRYKNQVSVDAEHKVVGTYQVTPANIHDRQVLCNALDPDNADPGVCADRAHGSEETETQLAGVDYDRHIHEKAQANRPLDEAAQERNLARPKIRSRSGPG